MAKSSTRNLDDEFPLDCGWLDVFHDAGHASRASSDWMNAFIERRLESGDSPDLACAIWACAQEVGYAQGRAGFDQALARGARFMMGPLPEHQTDAQHAFEEARNLFEQAAESWTPPTGRASRWIKESPRLTQFQTRANFSRLAKSAQRYAAGPFDRSVERAFGTAQQHELDYAHASTRQDRGMALQILCSAFAPATKLPKGWTRGAGLELLAKGFSQHTGKALMEFAMALSDSPTERGEILGKACSMAATKIYAQIVKSQGDSKKGHMDYYGRAGQLRTASVYFSEASAHVASPARAMQGVDAQEFWSNAIDSDWNGPAFALASQNIAKILEHAPAHSAHFHLAMAMARPKEAGQILGPENLEWEAWRMALKTRVDHRYASLHMLLAKHLPHRELEAQSLQRCPGEMAARIEKLAVDEAIGTCFPAADDSHSVDKAKGKPRL